MNLKNAAFLALAGMVLVTLLLVFSLIGDVFGVARGVVPAMGWRHPSFMPSPASVWWCSCTSFTERGFESRRG
jgi:hypothetical protein